MVATNTTLGVPLISLAEDGGRGVAGGWGWSSVLRKAAGFAARLPVRMPRLFADIRCTVWSTLVLWKIQSPGRWFTNTGSK